MQVPRFVLVAAAACLATVSRAIEFNAVPSGDSNAAVSTGANNGANKFVVSTENAPETAADGGFAVGSSVAVNAADYVIAAACKAQTWTITQKSANSIQLQFSSIQLPDGDALVAVAENGVEVKVEPATSSETTTNAVLGSTIKLQYRPSPSCSASSASFSLDRLIVRKTTVTKEAVCGVNTMENVKCFANSTTAEDRKMYELSKAVFRTQRIRNDGKIVVCTAWLWGNKGHVVTNNHCFTNQTMVDASQFDFGVEAPSCEAKCLPGTCPIKRALKGQGNVKFIASDPNLDIALMQIQGAAANEIVSTFGYLRILFGMPKLGEEIYIPQHPGGAARQIAKTDDDSNKSIATVKAVNADVDVDGTTFTGLVGYTADTESGSSGSPVISRSRNLVVGLHRIGYCNNAATPSKDLLGYLVPLAKSNDGVFA